MRTIDVPTLVTLEDLPRGTLIRTPNAEHSFGFVLGAAGSSTSIGWLTGTKDLVAKYTYHVTTTTRCLTYGNNWILETDPAHDIDEDYSKPGLVLYVGPNGWEFRFRGLSAGDQILQFNQSNARTPENRVVAIKAWRLWTSDDARQGPDRLPLIDKFPV